DPVHPSWRAALGEMLAAAGDSRGAIAALAPLVAADPRVASYRRLLADAQMAVGDGAAAHRTLIDGLAWTPEAQEVHRALAALGEPDVPSVIEAWRVDGRKVIADFEHAGTSYASPSVIVLDRTVTLVFKTGA